MTTPSIWVRPGSWTAFCGHGVWVLAETGTDTELLQALWQAVSSEDASPDVILTRLMSRGFENLGGFAIAAARESSVRLVARHPASATLSTGARTENVAPSASITWSDLSLDLPRSLVLAVESEPAATLEFPLALGATAAGSLRIEFGEAEGGETPGDEVTTEDPQSLISDMTASWNDELHNSVHAVPLEVEQPDTDDSVLTVLAVRCLDGHPSNPLLPHCRVCGSAIPDQTPQSIPRPQLGQITMPNGDTVPLDKNVVLGRAPQAIEEGDQHLVTVNTTGEISRMHALITLDGWNVLVRDLDTTNGTFLTLPGEEPLRLRSGEDYIIEPGSEIDLADVLTVRFQVRG